MHRMRDGEHNYYRSGLGSVWVVRNAMIEASCQCMRRGGLNKILKYKTPSHKLFLRVCSPVAVGGRVQPELVGG